MQIEIQAPQTKRRFVPAARSDGQAKAEAIAANARFRGLLFAPGTWQGDLVAEAQAPVRHRRRS